MGMVVPIFLYLGVKKLFMPESVIFSQKIFQLYQQPAFSSYFIRTWVAGISEEFLFGIVIVLIGMIAAYYAMRSAKIDTSSPYSKAFIIGIGSLLSVGLFAFFHTLNPTYAGADFIWALVFRFLMNLIIWGLGAFAFAVGYHIMNNSIAIGISILGAGLISIPAIPILILLAIMVWSVFTWRESIDFTLGAVSKARG